MAAANSNPFTEDIWIRCGKLLHGLCGDGCTLEERQTCLMIAEKQTERMFREEISCQDFIKKRDEFLNNQITNIVYFLMDTSPDISADCQALRKEFLEVIVHYTFKYFAYMIPSIKCVLTVLKTISQEDNDQMIFLSFSILSRIIQGADSEPMLEEVVEAVKDVLTVLFGKTHTRVLIREDSSAELVQLIRTDENQLISLKILTKALQLVELMSVNTLLPLDKLVDEKLLHNLNFSSDYMCHILYFEAMMKFLTLIHTKLSDELRITLMGLLHSNIYDPKLSIQMQIEVCKFIICCARILILHISSAKVEASCLLRCISTISCFNTKI